MTQAEAERLVAKLFAAFPSFHVEHDELTLMVYIEQLARMREYDVALQAVDELIRSERHLPTVSTLLDHYQTLLRRAPKPLAIEDVSAVVSEEQRQENIRQARAMVARLAAGTTLA